MLLGQELVDLLLGKLVGLSRTIGKADGLHVKVRYQSFDTLPLAVGSRFVLVHHDGYLAPGPKGRLDMRLLRRVQLAAMKASTFMKPACQIRKASKKPSTNISSLFPLAGWLAQGPTDTGRWLSLLSSQRRDSTELHLLKVAARERACLKKLCLEGV